MSGHSDHAPNKNAGSWIPKMLPRIAWGLALLILLTGLSLRGCHPADPGGHMVQAPQGAAIPQVSAPSAPTVPEDLKCSHFLSADQWSSVEAPVGKYSDLIDVPAGMATAMDPDLGSGKFLRECFDLLGSEVECSRARKIHFKSANPASVQKVYYRFCYRDQ